MPLDVINGSGAGWSLSATSTQWSTGGADPRTLATTATTVGTAPTQACVTGQACVLATNNRRLPVRAACRSQSPDSDQAVQRDGRHRHREPDGHPAAAAARSRQRVGRRLHDDDHTHPEQRSVMRSNPVATPARSRRPRRLVVALVASVVAVSGSAATSAAWAADVPATVSLQIQSQIVLTSPSPTVPSNQTGTLTVTISAPGGGPQPAAPAPWSSSTVPPPSGRPPSTRTARPRTPGRSASAATALRRSTAVTRCTGRDVGAAGDHGLRGCADRRHVHRRQLRRRHGPDRRDAEHHRNPGHQRDRGRVVPEHALPAAAVRNPRGTGRPAAPAAAAGLRLDRRDAHRGRQRQPDGLRRVPHR